MATYLITAKNGSNEALVSVGISGIDQEPQVVDELTVVNAVRDCLAAVAGVQSVVAQKFQQVITVV